MTMVLKFEEDIVRVICAYSPQSGRTKTEKQWIIDEMVQD